MMSDFWLLLPLLLSVSVISKPIDVVPLVKDPNATETREPEDRKDFGEVPRPFVRSSISPVTSAPSSSTEITEFEISGEKLGNTENATDNVATRQQGFAWILAPLAQKIQFSPQAFFQDKIGQLKDTLSQLGSYLPNQQDGGSKQFANTGLANLVGLNDSGFYTDRLDPAGFFGGNGWFANKGGILGGPGAFISTGSLFTDYPTPYRK